MKVHNRQVNGQSNYKRAAPVFHNEDHRMHMLVVAMNYDCTSRPLTNSTDAKNVEELARQCGVQSLQAFYNEQCTKDVVLGALRQLASECGPDDYLICYLAGHGTDLSDARGREADGQQEAFVCVNRRGQVSPETVISDSEFCEQVLPLLHADTRILILTDCQHPGTILDLSRPAWEGRQAISIAGCQDGEYSEANSRSGIFTHSLLLAIDKLSKVGRDNYSVGMLFNAALHEDEIVFDGKQDVVLQAAPKFTTDAMAWPLVPPIGYQAPLSRCADPGARSVSPSVLQHVARDALNVPVSIEEYVNYVQGGALFQIKPCRACTAGCSAGQCLVQ